MSGTTLMHTYYIFLQTLHKIRPLFNPNSREAESENASLVVQGMLMEFECRFLKRMVWCISFDIWLCLNVVHSYGIHGNT